MPAPLSDTKTTIGEKIRRARIDRGLNQRELAALANLQPSVISAVETRVRDPQVFTVYAIAIALGVRMEDLMGVQRVEKTTRGRVAAKREKVRVNDQTDEPDELARERDRVLWHALTMLEQARLYGEKMTRDRDDTVRRCGADLLGILDDA